MQGLFGLSLVNLTQRWKILAHPLAVLSYGLYGAVALTAYHGTAVELPTSSTITGVGGAAGRRQPASAKTACNVTLHIFIDVDNGSMYVLLYIRIICSHAPHYRRKCLTLLLLCTRYETKGLTCNHWLVVFDWLRGRDRASSIRVVRGERQPFPW